MSLLDRLHDVVAATGGALQAPVGFVKDTALAFPELATFDLPSFTGDVYKALTSHGADELASLIGPEGIGGTIIGGLPEPVRQGTHEIIDPIQNDMESAYHALIGRPLSTVFTAASLAEAGPGSSWDAWQRFLTSGDLWAEAYNIAEHRSPGQSAALAFMTKDIRDPRQLAKAQASDWYNVTTGTLDAAFRIFDDPTALALGATTNVLKVRRSIEAVPSFLGLGGRTGQQAIDQLSARGHVAAFADRIGAISAEHGDGAAAVIRHQFFPRDPLGAQISDILAKVDRLPEGMFGDVATTGDPLRQKVLRALMGSEGEIEDVRSLRPDLAGQLDRLQQSRAMLKSMGNNGFALANHTEDIANIQKEIDTLHPLVDRTTRLEALAGSLRSLPRTGGGQALRGRFSLGDFYQSSAFAKPLRTIFSMEPHPWIHLDDPGSDISVWRMLQKSDLPLDEQLAWRANYMSASSPVARLEAVAAAEDAAVASVAEKAGMSRAEINQALREASKGRGMAKHALDSRAYDGEGRSIIRFEGEDGVMHETHMFDAPLYETQLPNLAPIVDMDKVRAAIDPIRKFTRRIPGHEVAPALMDNLASVWKPAVLLRVGFPVRFLTDETLRSMSKIGVLSTVKNLGHGGRDAVGSVLEKVGFSPREMEMLDLGSHSFEGAFGAPGDMANIYRKLIEARESFGTLISKDEGKILDQLIQSGPWRSVHPTETATTRTILGKVRNVYAAAWEHAVNNQIGKSKLGERLLEDMVSSTRQRLPAGGEKLFERIPASREDTVARVVDWLKTTPEGQTLRDQLPIRKDLEGWVGAAYDQIDAYLPTDELKSAAWSGNATHDMLTKAVPNVADQPIVHGGIVDTMMGQHPAWRAWRKFVDAGMRNLVGKPSNVLIRNPFFDHMYQAELKRQVELFTGEAELTFPKAMVAAARREATGTAHLSLPKRISSVLRGEATYLPGDGVTLSAQDLEQMQWRARRYATQQTKDLFHNFAEEPSLAKTLGFMSPFYTAWSQIMSRWAGIAVDNPAFVRRLQLVWRAPEKMGIVTDGKGNVVDADGRIVTPVANSQYKPGDKAADDVRNVTIHLPDWARDIPGLKNTGDFEFGKDTLNMILHGLPPVGPPVQIAMNEVAKARPDLESSLHWALPYGVTQNSLDILKPTLIRRLETTSEGDANRSYAFTAMRVYTDKMVDYNLGKRAKPPTWAEAEADTQAFWHMRTIASFVLPVTPQFTSPYQAYIDSYRSRRDLDAKMTPDQKASAGYETPDEWFLRTYGEDFFPLVASMSKSIDGIPPTLEGAKAHEKYGQLVAKYPELGSLIAGAEGAGEFSRSVYEKQFAAGERQVRSHDEYATEASTKLGWIEFGKTMDMLDALRVERGLASFNVRGAEDLAAAKRALVDFLANDPQRRYAGWYEDYAASDASKWDHRIAGLTAIVSDPKMKNRPEIAGLAQYLEGRAQIVNTMTALGTHMLSARVNQGLSDAWDNYVGQIVDHNLAFGSLYNRWLQNDPVVISPITVAAQSGTYA